jgi:hypothetical protein
MYRIKAPKGGQNYWVPILANPDVVEHYSENVVDTLHKKNLLLLGEDRYLSTLMLKTFPKRKQVFVPQAVCKTTVPDSFKVLLSQRRRWINSTVHNLMELVLVRDLCGTFCFSMQFVVFIELIGTLVLPAAIAFTFYLSKRAGCGCKRVTSVLTRNSCDCDQSGGAEHGGACDTAGAPCAHLGVASDSDCRDSAPMVVCGMDVCLLAVTPRLELCAPDVRILEV